MLRNSVGNASVFDVSPYDGGWALKIHDTGEVLFFKNRRQARARATSLAAAVIGAVRVEVQDRARPEHWPTSFPYQLGASL